jgi:hypothetical protein
VVRVECERCENFAEIGRLGVVEGGLGFVCPTCGAANVVAGPEAPPEPAPVAENACPKCGHVQADEHACHRCGLVFARFDAASAGDPLAGHPAEAAIRARWAALQGRLDDREGHLAFIQLCAEQNLLEYAGHCYRRLTPAGELEDPRVAFFRERVVKAALARIVTVEGRRTEQLGTRLRSLLILTFLALMVLGFAVGYYLLARNHANHVY